MNTQLTRYIDEETGEVKDMDMLVPLSDPSMKALISGKLPFHIEMLAAKGLDSEEEEYQLSLFTGSEPKGFAEYINNDINVIGVIAYPHGPYEGKDGEMHPGYWQMLIAIDEKDRNGNNVILATSSIGVFSHMANALRIRGWYIWDKPVKYRVSKGTNGAYYMRNVDRPPVKVKQIKNA